MKSSKSACALASIALLASGCVTLPSGPSVTALPGDQHSFEQFQEDDWSCRDWAAQQSGAPADEVAAENAVVSAAVGTAVGAAAGVLIGAATGDVGAGAAIGAGSGLLVGSAAGVGRANAAAYEVQQRYDSAYVQCMYAKGNQVPVASSAVQQRVAQPPAAPYRAIPQPPRGSPPPPPPPRGSPPPPPPDA